MNLKKLIQLEQAVIQSKRMFTYDPDLEAQLEYRLKEVNAASCPFVVPWVGYCKRLVLPEQTYCYQHRELTCYACGNPAHTQCPETLGSFVCGVACCKDHRHHY